MSRGGTPVAKAGTQHERSVAAAGMISPEGIVHVVCRKSLLIAGGVVSSPHAAKQRPDKFRRAISGSTWDTTGAAVPDTAPFGLLRGTAI